MSRSYLSATAFVLTAVVLAFAATPTAPKPGPEHKKMEAFVGKWTYTGEAKQSPFGPAGKVSGTDVYAMIADGFFLQHHWEEKNPLGNIKGTEIWGYDPIKKAYTYNYFTSAGEMGSGTIVIEGNKWSFIGSGITYEGKTAYGKFVMTLAAPTTIKVRAEASSDGKTYALGFEGTWTKAK